MNKAKQIQIRKQVYCQNIVIRGQFTEGCMDNLPLKLR